MRIERLLTEAFRYDTDSEIGAYFGADPVMANNWRRGKHKPSYSHAQKLRKFHLNLVRRTLSKASLDEKDKLFLFESLQEFQQELHDAQLACNEMTFGLLKASINKIPI